MIPALLHAGEGSLRNWARNGFALCQTRNGRGASGFFIALDGGFPPITDDLDASVPPPPKSGPSQDATAAIPRFTR